MIQTNKLKILKKWLPLIGIVSLIVVVIGFIFGRSPLQILFSIVISVILILSALLFRSVGRDRRKNDEEQNGRKRSDTNI